MQDYFKLQLKLNLRKLKDFGIHPILGVFLLLLFFVLSSLYLFDKTSFAAPVYVVVATLYLLKNNHAERIFFLKSIYNKQRFYKLRLLENLLTVLPFQGFLLYFSEFVSSFILLLISIITVLSKVILKNEFVLPTPFSKRPFEFLVGIRKYYYIVFVFYFFALMGIIHNNINLGIFAILMIYVLSLSFYTNPEDPYFVWSFNCSPAKFLLKKIGAAVLQSSYLIALPLIGLGLFYSSEWHVFLLLYFIGLVFLTATILAKYASYPHQMHAPYQFILFLSVLFPVLLIFVFPYFYRKSLLHLKDHLK
jgi:hypothetical protein